MHPCTNQSVAVWLACYWTWVEYMTNIVESAPLNDLAITLNCGQLSKIDVAHLTLNVWGTILDPVPHILATGVRHIEQHHIKTQMSPRKRREDWVVHQP